MASLLSTEGSKNKNHSPKGAFQPKLVGSASQTILESTSLISQQKFTVSFLLSYQHL